MKDLSLKEKLLPSLLDRLIDDSPNERKESRKERIQTLQSHREAVLRDLEWLMNTECLESAHDLSEYPLVAQSVVNFGMPSLAGSALSAVDVAGVESRIAKAILSFEPRILKDSLKVQSAYASEDSPLNSLTFEIMGDLWALPIPQRVFLRTELDLETGNIDVSQVTER